MKEKEKILTERQIEDKCKSIDCSSQQYKNILRNCKNPKFSKLDKWLNFQATTFTKENNRPATKFLSYKQGTIVYLNFGASIGAELSGNHFAIVLNKKDNPSKGTLTVVPLTSKNKKYYLPLQKELMTSILHGSITESFNIFTLGDKIKTEFNPDSDIKEHDSVNMEFIISYLHKYMDMVPANDGVIHIHEGDILKVMNDNLVMIKQVNAFYSKNNKESYAMIDSIATVSKYRIMKPLNRMDPIGRVQISPNVLDSIEREFIKRFTSQLLTKYQD